MTGRVVPATSGRFPVMGTSPLPTGPRVPTDLAVTSPDRHAVRYASGVESRRSGAPGERFIRATSTNHHPTRVAARFPCFDGLRALAALTVIGVHTSFVSGFTGRSQLGRYTSRLEIGVAVFFVISGFLLYRPFAAAHFLGEAATPMRKFWARRLRRIIPAYWAAFIVITYVLHADTIRPGWGSLAIYLGFAQIYSPNHVLTGITQAWSLCTEMSFYLLLPLWAGLVGRRRRSAGDQLRVELAGLAILVITSFGFRTWVLQWHTSVATTMPDWLPAYADLFALGMLLAVVSTYLGATDQRPGWLWHPALPWASWALAGLAFWAVCNIGLPVTPRHPFAGRPEPCPPDPLRLVRVLHRDARGVRPPGSGLGPTAAAAATGDADRCLLLRHLSLAPGRTGAVLPLDGRPLVLGTFLAAHRGRHRLGGRSRRDQLRGGGTAHLARPNPGPACRRHSRRTPAVRPKTNPSDAVSRPAAAASARRAATASALPARSTTPAPSAAPSARPARSTTSTPPATTAPVSALARP